jgi:hypothetical protein
MYLMLVINYLKKLVLNCLPIGLNNQLNATRHGFDKGLDEVRSDFVPDLYNLSFPFGGSPFLCPFKLPLYDSPDIFDRVQIWRPEPSFDLSCLCKKCELSIFSKYFPFKFGIIFPVRLQALI